MTHNIFRAVSASVLALALSMSPGTPGAVAASAVKNKHAVTTQRVHRAYAMHRTRQFRSIDEARYGGIPPNAIRMPGYVFVPGVGILGESCDLPTSSCSNENRDIQ